MPVIFIYLRVPFIPSETLFKVHTEFIVKSFDWDKVINGTQVNNWVDNSKRSWKFHSRYYFLGIIESWLQKLLGRKLLKDVGDVMDVH